jgi:hypothetical protein
MPGLVPQSGVRVQGRFTLARHMMLDGLQPELVDRGMSLRITAVLPGGGVEPIVWLHGYDSAFPHPFLLRRPLRLPAGTQIDGVPFDARVILLPASR